MALPLPSVRNLRFPTIRIDGSNIRTSGSPRLESWEDVTSGRRRDIEDMRQYAQRGLDYESILNEIEEQRPFNTGLTEARQIRDQSHPLFAIEIATNSLSGIPNTFISRVAEFATEFEIEYTVLGAVDDGIDDVEAIQNRVLSNVRMLQDDQKEAVDDAIDRMVDKHILERDGTTIRLK